MFSLALIGALLLSVFYIFLHNTKPPKPLAGIYTRPGGKTHFHFSSLAVLKTEGLDNFLALVYS